MRRLVFCCLNCSRNISRVLFPDWMTVLRFNSSARSPETIVNGWKMAIADGKVSPLAFFRLRKTLEYVTIRAEPLFCSLAGDDPFLLSRAADGSQGNAGSLQSPFCL